MMPNDATNEPNPPPLPRYTGSSKVSATWHPNDGPTPPEPEPQP